MICAFLFVTASQVGQDASVLYKQIQARVARASGFSQEYTTGPDSWDTDVQILYDRSGRFSKGHKNYSLRCDGKWFLELDTGEVTHRPAKPNEIYYVPGLESLYPNTAPLEVFGPVEDVKPFFWSDFRAWKIKYRKDGKVEFFLVDPATRLPLHVTLLPYGTQVKPFPVPAYRKQTDVVKQSAKALAEVKSILLTRKIYSGGTEIDELILMFRNGKAFVQKMSRNTPYPIRTTPAGDTWIGKGKPVLAKTLALPGFESFTGAKVPEVTGDAKLAYGLGYSRNLFPVSSFAWNTKPKSGPWQQVRYGELSFWPDSAYVYRSWKVGNSPQISLQRRLSYNIERINPKISLPR